MREYKLEISGGEDFVIITPQMLSALIFRIHKLCRQKLVVAVKDIVPADMEEYLGRMINTNRHAAPCFHYCQISEDPITKRGLYRILRQQLEGLEMERRACFQSIVLADTIKGEAGFDIVCATPFFWACRDTAVKFIYFCPDGRQENLVLEYGENF